ncbi:MAG: glycosyltransferase family 2 protein [Planctomycetes bacterium]|nr:glycosyltransferase family 2 protein [Planctomycetota bacterium]MBI3846487.1 glycosyltransferase family 2 protein [Planctomycetota bacterium]
MDESSASATVDLSIVIVSYNTRDILRQCLRSVLSRLTELRAEIIVVDNASRDGSDRMVACEFPGVRLIRNSQNEGYSAANNRAFGFCRGRHVLLLNSDTIVLPGTLEALIEFMDRNPPVGVAGCRLDRPNGELDLACRRSFPTPLLSLYRLLRLSRLFPSSRRFARYNLTYLDPSGCYEVDSVVGAFMLVRREVIDEMGGLDERYFMYGEDLDWCYRARQRSWKVWYVGAHRVVHYKGASSSQESFRMNYHFHRAMYLFHRKHLSQRYSLLINWLVYVGISSRFIGLAIQHPIRLAIRGVRRATRDQATAERVFPLEFFVGSHAVDGVQREVVRGDRTSP